MKKLLLAFVLALAIAPLAESESLPLPSIACDSGGGVTTGTCDAKPQDDSTSPWVLTRPTRLLAGDLLVSSCTVDTVTIGDMTGGSTWNQIGTEMQIAFDSIPDTFITSLWWKIAGDGEPATYGLSGGGGGTNSFGACAMTVWRSVAQSSTYEGNIVETSGSDSSPTCGSITTASANAMAFCYCGAAENPTYTAPSGYTEEVDENGTAHFIRNYPSAGATGDAVATLSVANNWICRHASFAYNTAGKRVYLPSSGAPAVSPTFDASWEDSDQADRIAAVFTRGSTAMADSTSNEESADTTAKDHLNRQYAIQIGAQTITGVVQCNVRAIESDATANAVAGLKLWLANSAGTSTSEVLLDSTNAGNSTDEYASGATCSSGCAARNFPAKARTHTLSSQTAANNDYLVMEFGSYYNNTSGTARTETFRFGDTAATALDRNDTSTTDNHPWCDFLGGLAAPSVASTFPGGIGRNW